MMKKISIIIISVFYTVLAFGQSNEEPCLTCDGNKIDFTKGASAIGTRNESLGINSFAVGYLNEAHGDYSVAMPFLARSYGNRSIALGYNANTVKTLSHLPGGKAGVGRLQVKKITC